jgi:hypothetical protein
VRRIQPIDPLSFRRSRRVKEEGLFLILDENAVAIHLVPVPFADMSPRDIPDIIEVITNQSVEPVINHTGSRSIQTILPQSLIIYIDLKINAIHS